MPRGKLVLVNDDDLTYCTLRLDPGSLATLIDRIGDIAEPLPRTLCWSAAWEMTREAELKARDFIALVAGGFGAETEIGVVQRLLLQAQTAIMSYADEQWAAERGWPLLVDALRFRLDTAPAGLGRPARRGQRAGRQRPARARCSTGCAAGSPDDDVPDGLAVDTDLRWRLLHALVAHGAPATTPSGDRRRAGARPHLHRAAAGRAGPRADPDRGGEGAGLAAGRARRRAAERRATRRSSAGSPTRRSGRCSPRTSSGTSPTSPTCGQRRTSERAQPVVVGLFPAWAVDKATVDAADAWLADESHPPALRRLVSEGRAGIVRALAAREFDRS